MMPPATAPPSVQAANRGTVAAKMQVNSDLHAFGCSPDVTGVRSNHG